MFQRGLLRVKVGNTGVTIRWPTHMKLRLSESLAWREHAPMKGYSRQILQRSTARHFPLNRTLTHLTVPLIKKFSLDGQVNLIH
jgi:hypothetical protein